MQERCSFRSRCFPSCGRCLGEQGWTESVVGHAAAARARGQALPRQFEIAEAARPKLTEITGRQQRPRVIDEEVDMDELSERLSNAHFSGKGDDKLVMKLTYSYTWKHMLALRDVLNQAGRNRGGSPAPLPPGVGLPPPQAEQIV